MKKCSTSLIIRKMQIKTTMSITSYLSQCRKEKNTRNKCWWGCGEKRNSRALLVGNANWCSHWKKVWRFLKKLKIELPYNLIIPPWGIYPKKTKNTNSKRYMHFYCSIIYNS